MRQYAFMIALLGGLFVSSVTFAEQKHAKDYYTSSHAKPAAALQMNVVKKLATVSSTASDFFPTNITVINASISPIYATIPGSDVYDRVNPQANLHIYNDYLYEDTFLVLKDTFSEAFYSGPVCNRAIMTVYGRPGYYSVHVDNEFCS